MVEMTSFHIIAASALPSLLCGCGGMLAPTASDADGAAPGDDMSAIIGAACPTPACPERSLDASALPSTPACYRMAFGDPLPDGDCTLHCATRSDCPAAPGQALLCGAPSSSMPFLTPICLQACEPDIANQCRDGYSCRALLDANGVPVGHGCWILDY